MKIAKETVAVFKDEIIIIRDSVNDSVDMMRDTKHDLRDEIIRTEKLLEKVEMILTSQKMKQLSYGQNKERYQRYD